MIVGVIYNENVFATAAEEDERIRDRYYDSDSQCEFLLLNTNDRDNENFYLKIIDDSPYTMRGFSISEIRDIVKKKFRLLHNEHIIIKDYVYDFRMHHMNAFYRTDLPAFPSIEDGKGYDYIDFLTVLRSLLVEMYPASGLSEVSGILEFEKKSSFKLQMKIDTEYGEKTVYSIPVLFDGEYFYSVYNDMKPMDPYRFIDKLVAENGDVRLTNKSSVPKKFTRVLPDTVWSYLTGQLMPDSVKELDDIINLHADGNVLLMQNPEFKKYICNRYLGFKNIGGNKQ